MASKEGQYPDPCLYQSTHLDNQTVSDLIISRLSIACSADKEVTANRWLAAANAFSFQHKHQAISCANLALMSEFMDLNSSQAPGTQTGASSQAMKLLLLLVSKLCSNAHQQSHGPITDQASNFAWLHPGVSVQQLCNSISALDSPKAAGAPNQQNAHIKWTQSLRMADVSVRKLHAASGLHHLIVLRSTLLMTKLLLLTQQSHSALNTEAVTKVLWLVLSELARQLGLRHPGMKTSCACCEAKGMQIQWDLDADMHSSRLLAKHLLRVLCNLLKAKQAGTVLCCNILTGLMYSATDTNVWPSVAQEVSKPGGLATLAKALDGNRLEAESALDVIRYCLDLKLPAAQNARGLLLLARMDGVRRLSTLLCPAVGEEDEGDWLETVHVVYGSKLCREPGGSSISNAQEVVLWAARLVVRLLLVQNGNSSGIVNSEAWQNIEHVAVRSVATLGWVTANITQPPRSSTEDKLRLTTLYKVLELLEKLLADHLFNLELDVQKLFWHGLQPVLQAWQHAKSSLTVLFLQRLAADRRLLASQHNPPPTAYVWGQQAGAVIEVGRIIGSFGCHHNQAARAAAVHAIHHALCIQEFGVLLKNKGLATVLHLAMGHLADDAAAQLTAATCLLLLYDLETWPAGKCRCCQSHGPASQEWKPGMLDSCLSLVISITTSFMQHKQPLEVLLIELLGKIESVIDVVFFQQQLLLSVHCVLKALCKTGSLTNSQTLEQRCIATLPAVAFAGASSDSSFSVHANIGFPLDSWADAAQAVPLQSTLRLCDKQDLALFWGQAFSAAFSHFANVVAGEMAALDEPGKPEEDWLNMQPYISMLVTFADRILPGQSSEADTPNQVQASQLVLQSLLIALVSSANKAKALESAETDLENHKAEASQMQAPRLASEVVTAVTDEMRTSHDTSLCQIHQAQLRLARLETGLQGCAQSLVCMLNGVTDLCGNAQWASTFKSLVAADGWCQQQGILSRVSSSIASLKTSNFAPIEFIEDLEETLLDLKEGPHAQTIIEQHLAEEERAQAQAAEVKARKKAAARQRRTRRQLTPHQQSLRPSDEQAAVPPVNASISHHTSVAVAPDGDAGSNKTEPDSVIGSTIPTVYMPEEALACRRLSSCHLTDCTQQDTASQLHQDAQPGYMHASCNLWCCPLTKVNLLLQEEMQDPVIAADGHTYEKAAIEHWLHNSDQSPILSVKLRHKRLVPNVLIRQCIALDHQQ